MAKVYKNYFKSINEFLNYLETNETNKLFKDAEKCTSQDEHNEHWSGTENYEAAIKMIKNGWSEMANKITKTLNVKPTIRNKAINKPHYSVCGYQASVPRYLQGIPQNMVNSKKVMRKQPVVTINKSITYGCSTTTDEIVAESIKALEIIKAIEEKGTRVNLNIILCAEMNNEVVVLKIRIKGANEKLNISKMAFPLAHPSMIRRFYLRFLEIHKEIKRNAWTFGYGKPQNGNEIREHIEKGEYLIPERIKGTAEQYLNEMEPV